MSSTRNALTVTALEGVPYIDYSREFDAPVAEVFRAHGDPAMLAHWLGPDGYEMQVERYDFTTGGGYRYVHRAPDGGEYAFNGVFHVVRPTDFVVQTFEYEGFPGVVSLDSLQFQDLGAGRTRLLGHSVYPSQAARDGMVSSNMEQGMSEGYAKLEALLGGESARTEP